MSKKKEGSKVKEFVQSDKGKICYWFIWGTIIIISIIFLVPPIFDAVVNKVDPFVLGMPWIAFMQILLWVILSAALFALFWVQNWRDEL